MKIAGMPEAPAPRELDIEDFLVWVYKGWATHKIVERGIGLEEAEAMLDRGRPWRSSSMTAAVCRHAELRTFFNRTGPRVAAPDLPQECEDAHRMVLSLPADLAALVIRCAELGQRPAWGRGVVPRLRPVPTKGKDGRLKRGQFMVVRTPGGRPYYCPVQPVPDPQFVLKVRQAYADWHRTLGELRAAMGHAGITRPGHRLTGPACAPAPWRTPSDAIYGYLGLDIGDSARPHMPGRPI